LLSEAWYAISASVISGIGELPAYVSKNIQMRSPRDVHSQVEHDSKQEDKACDGQIDPLHILQRTLVVADVVEDSIASNDGCYNGTDTRTTSVIIGRKDRICPPLTH
jgi:hypothetical protein